MIKNGWRLFSRIMCGLVLSSLLHTGCIIIPHPRYLASEVEGQILRNGEPVQGAKAVRKMTIVNSKKTQFQAALTDHNGRFVWKPVRQLGMVHSIATWVFDHSYYIEEGGQTILIWKGAKVDAANGAENTTPTTLLKRSQGKLTFTFDLARDNPVMDVLP